MKLKDLEKIKLLETALMIGVPFGMILHDGNAQKIVYNMISGAPEQNNVYALSTLIAIPRIVDVLLYTKLEPKAENYQQIKKLYDDIVSNLADFLKEQNITDPVEIFTIYQFMYRNGYLSYNHNFNYDNDMKDLVKLNGVDVINGHGVCRSIASFLTDLYRKMGYDACNLLVSANRKVLDNIDRRGKYPNWEISQKTKQFVKIISKVSDVIPISNHLISCVQKDEYTYVFDPTNDAFLTKGKTWDLVLPYEKEGRMKISWIMITIQKIYSQIGKLKSISAVKKQLQNSAIDYDEYKAIYDDTLEYAKSNIEIFDDFYSKNSAIYEELIEKVNSIPGFILRMYPEMNLINKVVNAEYSIEEKLKELEENFIRRR